MSGVQAPVRWGIVGLGWAAADFVAPAMVKSTGSRLSACLGSSLDNFHLVEGRLERHANRDTAVVFEQGSLGLAHSRTNIVGKLPRGRHLIGHRWHVAQGYHSLGE